jgi:hypothetical protein
MLMIFVRRALVLLLLGAAVSLGAQEADPPAGDQTGPEPPAAESDDDFFDDPLFDDPFATDGAEDESAADDDAFFDDPFAVSGDGESGNGDASTGSGESESEFIGTDELDSLFSTDEMIEDAAESDPEAAPESDLLVTEGVRWGGRISGGVSADFSWDDVWTSDFGLLDPTSESLSPSIGADLFFDARPEEEFRAFGKLKITTTSDGGFQLTGLTFDAGQIDDTNLPDGWTSEENEDGETEIRNEEGVLIITLPAEDDGTTDEEEPADEGSTGSAPGLEISVFELFADYVWNDTLFFRFGKHTIKWGTGYFFSPADVLNLTAVDAEDPTAEREGPLSLRIQYPFGITGNAYFYAITNTGAEPLDVAVAPKVEFAVGSGELGLGGYYQRTLAPRLVALYSGSFGEVDVFGEGVLLYGSDRVFVRPSRDQSAATEDPDDDLEVVLDTYEVSNSLFFTATAGARYLKEWNGGTSLALIGQYFFNGEGYGTDDADLLPHAARLLANPGENGLVIEDEEAQPEGYEDPPDLGFGDLTNWGRHYVGLTAALSNIRDTDLGVTAFALVNVNDWSGIVTPAISYRFLDRFSLSGSARFTFGGEDDEFTDPGAVFTGDPAEPTFGLTFSISMPGGSF